MDEPIQSTDTELVNKAVLGQKEAFEQLVSRYADRLYFFCFSYLREQTAAEDAVQETFIKLYLSKGHYDQRKKFSTWLYTIARNTCLDIVKKKLPLLFSELEGDNDDAGVDQGALIADPASLPESVTADLLFAEKLKKALGELPSSQSRVVEMHLFQDLTFQDISEVLAVPLNTVKSRYLRGLSVVRKNLLR